MRRFSRLGYAFLSPFVKGGNKCAAFQEWAKRTYPPFVKGGQGFLSPFVKGGNKCADFPDWAKRSYPPLCEGGLGGIFIMYFTTSL